MVFPILICAGILCFDYWEKFLWNYCLCKQKQKWKKKLSSPTMFPKCVFEKKSILKVTQVEPKKFESISKKKISKKSPPILSWDLKNGSWGPNDENSPWCWNFKDVHWVWFRERKKIIYNFFTIFLQKNTIFKNLW